MTARERLSHFTRRRATMWILTGIGVFWSLMLLAAVALILGNYMTPYQPFAVRGARIAHDGGGQTVCTHDKVKVLITRKFTTQFNSLHLQESWVTADSRRPVSTAEGTLPRQALHPTPGFETVSSPLLRRTPSTPGTYRVHVQATARGTRLGMHVSGTSEFTSRNTITVHQCADE